MRSNPLLKIGIYVLDCCQPLETDAASSMTSIQSPTKPNLRPKKPLTRPVDARRQHSQTSQFWETIALLTVSVLLSSVAIVSLYKMISLQVSQQAKLREVRSEVNRVEARVNRLQAQYDRNHDPQESSRIVEEQSSLIEAQQLRVVWVQPQTTPPPSP